jgi:fasciclin domain-containing protein/uncharacterized protein DUF4397
MFTNRLFTMFASLTLMTMILTACGSVPATGTVPTATSAVEIVNSPTTAPFTSSNTPLPKSTPAPVTCPCFEGLSSGLDNATQARIRIAISIMGEPNVDVYVNSMPASNGGAIQQNIGRNQFSGWLYVTPGTYNVALVPHLATLDQALFQPVAVEAKAGHRYTVALVGQVEDNDVRPLLVDETALENDAGLQNSKDMVMVELNNIKGAPAIDETFDGKPGVLNLSYGTVKAGNCTPGIANDRLVVTGHPEIVIGNWEGGSCDPGTRFFFPPNNDAPTGVGDGNISQGTSELNTLDFLDVWNSNPMSVDGHLLTFNTLLAAIEKAGLRDQLINSGPYFLMAPTDEAFDALSQADRDTLLNNPNALMTLLNAHIVDGYYPWGSLSGATYGVSDRIVINRLGQKLNFRDDVLNSKPIGANYTVGNGNRLQIIYTLLPVK